MFSVKCSGLSIILNNVPHTRRHFSNGKLMKAECRLTANVVVAGGTTGCHNDNTDANPDSKVHRAHMGPIDINHGTEPRDFLHDLTDLRSHNPKNMIIGHVNINSLRNKVDPIHGILSNSLCDILTLTGTKIDGSFPSAQFSVKNYALHRQDRNVHGGGIVTYIRSYLPHRRRTDIESNGNGIETIVFEVQLHEKEKWFICSCYKPPHTKNSVFESNFNKLLTCVQMESPHILILGDLNFNMNVENVLSDLCCTYNLRNLVSGPTCFKGANPTALDVILSSEPKRCKNTMNKPCFFSDYHNICVLLRDYNVLQESLSV